MRRRGRRDRRRPRRRPAVAARLLALGDACRAALARPRYRWNPAHAVVVGVACAFVAAIALIAWLAWAGTTHRLAEEQRRAAIRCLAANVYHEARGEPREGQVAVAEVTMNRVASPRFPDSVCAVVHQEAAFSWTLGEPATPRGRAWERAVAVAARVHDGDHEPVVPEALHYHARGVDPYWARGNPPIRTIGSHVFYR